MLTVCLCTEGCSHGRCENIGTQSPPAESYPHPCGVNGRNPAPRSVPESHQGAARDRASTAQRPPGPCQGTRCRSPSWAQPVPPVGTGTALGGGERWCVPPPMPGKVTESGTGPEKQPAAVSKREMENKRSLKPLPPLPFHFWLHKSPAGGGQRDPEAGVKPRSPGSLPSLFDATSFFSPTQSLAASLLPPHPRIPKWRTEPKKKK